MKPDYYIRKKRPNYLLQGLLLFSLGIHALLLLHITGLYESGTLHYIEMTLRKEKSSSGRILPGNPEIKDKESGEAGKESIYNSSADELPDADPIGDASDYSRSGTFWAGMEEDGVQENGEHYIDIVKRIIEQHKKYPDEAADMYKEGIVSLSFVINQEGHITDLRIVRASPYIELNEAALQAVRDSAPFPKPPPHIFKGGVVIPLNLTFELL